jgi:hypothetical protein
VNPLVITETGTLKPIGYDFDARYDIGVIDGLTPERLRLYKQQGVPEFEAFIGQTLSGLQSQDLLVDWFDHCIRLSAQSSAPAVVGSMTSLASGPSVVTNAISGAKPPSLPT